MNVLVCGIGFFLFLVIIINIAAGLALRHYYYWAYNEYYSNNISIGLSTIIPLGGALYCALTGDFDGETGTSKFNWEDKPSVLF